MPFCLATDQIMPANDSEALAYNYLHGSEGRLPPGVQKSFIDMRRPPDIEVPHEPEEEDEDKRGIDLVELSPMHVPDVQDVAESEEEIDSVTGLEQAVTPTPIVDNEGEESSEEEEEEEED